VATVVREDLAGCEGFRLESQLGLHGWVEETWLGPAGEPAALAIRTIDGRDGLLVVEEVGAVVPESQLVVMRREGRLLELDVPRIESAPADGTRRLSASWQTTGETLELPWPPGPIRRLMLALRPWRLAPPPRPEAERPLWQVVALLYTALGVIVGLVIAAAFIIAYYVTGNF
jgi:hypothetical protein